MPRQQFAQNAGRPCFQSFRQQGVVGVGKDFCRDVPGGIPILTVNVHQQAHHFRNGQRGVGIVQLNANLIRHFAEIVAFLHKAADNILNGAGNEEILLFQAQLLAGFNRIGRVQNFGNCFGFDFVTHRFDIAAFIKNINIQLVVGFGREQPQIVDRFAVIADDRKIKRHAVHGFGIHPDIAFLAAGVFKSFNVAVHRNGNLPVQTGKLPGRVFALPGVGLLNLIAVVKFLFEQTELIVDAVAETGNAERSHGVQIAGG